MQNPPNLAAAAYIYLAQAVIDRAHMRKCQGCGRMLFQFQANVSVIARPAPAAGAGGKRNKPTSSVATVEIEQSRTEQVTHQWKSLVSSLFMLPFRSY